MNVVLFYENEISKGGSCYIFIIEIVMLSSSKSGFRLDFVPLSTDRSLHVDTETAERGSQCEWQAKTGLITCSFHCCLTSTQTISYFSDGELRAATDFQTAPKLCLLT